MRFIGSDKILLYMYGDSYGKNLHLPNNFISLVPYT